MKQLEGLDVTKCIGCRKGTLPFTHVRKGYIHHLDLFASAEAGEMYPCANKDVVEKHLTTTSRGIYDTSPELSEVMNWQASWWDDIMTILHAMFKGKWPEATDYINNSGVLAMSNKDMEDFIIRDAIKMGIVIDADKCPDLISMEKEVNNG